MPLHYCIQKLTITVVHKMFSIAEVQTKVVSCKLCTQKLSQLWRNFAIFCFFVLFLAMNIIHVSFKVFNEFHQNFENFYANDVWLFGCKIRGSVNSIFSLLIHLFIYCQAQPHLQFRSVGISPSSFCHRPSRQQWQW